MNSIKKASTSILFFLLSLSMNAQIDTKVSGNSLTLMSGQGDMRMDFCNSKMVRILKSTGKTFPENEPWMVVKYDFEPVDFHVLTTSAQADVTTDDLQITAMPNPWRITVKDKEGNVLYQETEVSISQQEGPKTVCRLSPDEHFFGFGERMDHIDQRGQIIHLNVELGHGTKPAVGGKDILRANYCPVPYFMSSKGYAVFFHNAAPTDWDMGWSDNRHYSFAATEGPLDYYFILGPKIEDMLHQYQTLTGMCPMMPRSAYGLHLGSYSGGTWKHEKEANGQYNVDLVKRMRKEGIPFDLLWLDSTWRIFNSRFGNGGCCFEFQPQFTNPKAMIDSIYAQHVDMFGLHIRSILDDGKTSTVFTEGKQAGILYPNAQAEGLVNFFDAKAVDWWWDHAMSKITSLGVKFVKTDVGSAFRLNEAHNSDYGAAQLHNLFPIAYARAPYNKFMQLNNQRGFTHTREGYAGIQRYPFIWAGDWGTEWQWFEPVIRGGLNIGLSGVGYWSHCMGGFEQYSDYDTDLYLRWCQFGMLSPVSILFGMDHPRYHEPWTYGEEAMRIFIKYDSLRYSLIPYIYSNAYRMYKTSRPLMTPLLYDWQNDELTYRISDQYMFGEGMMVCPVTVKNALSRPVYFPGGKWVDFWTGERIDGRQHKSFLTPPDLMPIFIREGAIIPQQPAMQYVNEHPVEVITLLCYPQGKSSYLLYDDDGKSMDYQHGIYSTTNIESNYDQGTWTLQIHKSTGLYRLKERSYAVAAFFDQEPSSVVQNGSPLTQISAGSQSQGWWYDADMKKLYVNSNLTNLDNITLEIK